MDFNDIRFDHAMYNTMQWYAVLALKFVKTES